MQRTVLFLQGPPSLFWPRLADAFSAAGAGVVRVNLCPADALYWPRRGAVAFRGRRDGWPEFLGGLISREKITDILYFGDRNPYHVAAAQAGREAGVRCHALEFGYMRPGWLTLERDGMGAFSHFPNDPAHIGRVAGAAPEPDLSPSQAHPFVVEAFNEVAFHMTNACLGFRYPGYAPDRFYPAPTEYLSSLRRWWWLWRDRRSTRRAMEGVEQSRWPYCLLPLQLQSDWQIRSNSPFPDQRDVLEMVLASLAAHASPDMRLLVKLHPMEVGMIDWAGEVARRAQHHGVADRVHFLDGGDLDALVEGAHGVVVNNSTVGLTALRAGVPVFAFGAAIYDVAGLVHRGELARFWTAPDPVDPALARDLVRALAAAIQLRGRIFGRSGRQAVLKEIVGRVLGDRVNEPGAHVDPPPRLSQASARQPVGDIT